MNVLHGALLGLIQGLGEFLPISSSGHLLLVQKLFGLEGSDAAMKMLDILLHVGTLIPASSKNKIPLEASGRKGYGINDIFSGINN